MNLSNTVRLPEAIVKAFSHSDAQPKERGKRRAFVAPPLSVTISRQAGAQGNTVARAVGRLLGWPVLDHELLEQMAAEMQVNVRLLDSIDEQHVPWLVEWMEAFSSIPFVSESAYVRQLFDTILGLAAKGDCIIVGRGGGHIVPPGLAVRVRLIADFADRARTMMHEMSCTFDEAERQVKALDRQRAVFVKNHFHCDAEAPENYDLLLNTSRLDVETCAHIVIETLESRRRAWSTLEA
ncbi:MAG TPA: cytidylate kinase-like family protein [Pirellulales bacterium]|nr:cytidylate kinase-like family protein [Pirellulales bacterium]